MIKQTPSYPQPRPSIREKKFCLLTSRSLPLTLLKWVHNSDFHGRQCYLARVHLDDFWGSCSPQTPLAPSLSFLYSLPVDNAGPVTRGFRLLWTACPSEVHPRLMGLEEGSHPGVSVTVAPQCLFNALFIDFGIFWWCSTFITALSLMS